jgi:filamentous hemagglutinin family protein
MNKIHNIIWSKSKKAFIVVAEGTNNCTKSGMRGLKVMIALILLSPSIGMSATLPQGGVISVGQGTIVNSNNTLTIKQTTDKLGVNWQSFNVGADGQVVFEQPNSKSVALNRVVGSDASAILGKIDANGQVILINPNGVMVGKDAQINVGGLVASTLNLTDENFQKGDYAFTAEGGKNGEVVNHGALQAAEGGYIALLGKSVKNQGIIKAKLGSAALAAGDAVTLDFAGDGLVNIQVNKSTLNALVENKGLIKADGGNVLMTARTSNALAQTVVNNDGIIEAQTLSTHKGKIFLDGGQDEGAVHVAGTIDASAPVAGDGGFIETSGKTVKIDDGTVITTKSKQGHSGTWLVDPTDFTISAGSGTQTASGIGAATLVTALGSGNVILQTAAGGTDKGDINVNADVAWDSDNTLTLTAANTINVNANINIYGSGNGGLVMNFTSPTYSIAKGSAITLSSSGTPTYTENGHAFFLIKSLNDLLQLDNAAKSGGYFALATSLDASATSGWNGGLGYSPASMGSTFKGTLNGLGNSITNLSINRPTQDNVGLISKSTNAIISNLGVSGTVSGNGSVGLIIGNATGGILSNVNSNGSVTGAASYTGGLVGQLNAGTLTNSYSLGSVSGTAYVGGIVGRAMTSANLSSIHSTANVTGSANNTGGLAGELNGSTLTDGYSEGTVSGNAFVGGVVGYSSSSSVISTVHSLGQVAGTGSNIGGLVGELNGSTLTDGYSQNTVSGSANVGGVVGTSSTSSSISTVHSTGNISGTGSVGGIVGYSTGSSSISGVYSTGNITGYANYTGGLVGQFSGGTLSNGYSQGTISGVGSVGGVVGWGNNYANIFTVYSSGDVTGTTTNIGGLVGYLTANSALTDGHSQGTISGAGSVGGVVGWGTGTSSISTVYSTGNVTNTGNNTGGLVGYLNMNSTLTNGYALGAVTGVSDTGGVVGWGTSGAMISNVHATGNVTSTGNYTGGLVGLLSAASLSNGYYHGAVSGASDVGGIVGRVLNSSFISDVNSTGSVSGTASNTGGLVGELNASTLTDSYSESTVSGVANVGGAVGWGTGNSNISTVYSTGNIVGTGSVGGVVGYANGNWNISSVYSTGNVSNTGSFTGGIIGQFNGGTLSDGYSLGSISGNASVGGVVGYGIGSAVISTVHANGNVTGTGSNTGGLVGQLDGSTLTDSYSQAVVSGTYNVGGVAGTSLNSANISSVYSTGNISGVGSVGGIVGYANTNSSISSVYSTSTVTGTGSYTGGLVGNMIGGTLTNAYALGNISGSWSTGGLVGYANSNANIDYAYSTGSVNGAVALTGGLVGQLDGSTLTNSYSTGSVSGALYVGGLIGRAINNANISTVFSTGNVIGTDTYVGGLLGGVDSSILHNAYATGSVSGPSFVAGLAGVGNNAQISNVYSTGQVLTPGIAGGLIASDTGTSTVSEAYWDTTLSGQATSVFGVGYASLTDAAIFSTWDVAHAGGSSSVWRMYDGLTGPLLRVFMGTATAAPGSASTITYNGQNQMAGDYPVSGLITDTSVGFFQPHANQNAWSFTQNGAAIRNAGSYVVDGWYSTQFGYDISDAVKSTIVIDKAALVVTATGVDRVYDGTTNGSVTFGDNRFAGDNLTFSSTATFTDKNVGTGKAVSVTGITATGSDSGNYTWNTTDSTTANITKAVLTLTATGVDKVYDGSTAASVTLGDNRIAGDALTLASNAVMFGDKNAGSGKGLNVSGITVTGADAGNYSWDTTASTTANITKKALVVTATGANKTYDGTTVDHVTLTDDRLAGDILTLTPGSATFADKNVGTGKAVSVTGITASGADADNYSWSSTATTTADITKAALNVSAIGQDRVYNGTTAGVVNLLDNRINGDDLTISAGPASFADKNAGIAKAINISGISVTGADAQNYDWNTTTSTTANITKAALNITASGINKTYDGTTHADVNLSDNRIGADDLMIGSGGANFVNKNAASGKMINVTGVTVTGADSGNYSWNSNITAIADIAKAALSVTAAGVNKTYDGTTMAGLTFSDNRIAGDSLSVSGAGSFADINAGASKSISVHGINITGADSGNYTWNSVTATVADIAKAALVVRAQNGSKVEGDSDGELRWDLQSGSLFGSDSISGLVVRDVGEVAGHYAINQGTLDAGTNYDLSFIAGRYDIIPPVIVDPITPPVVQPPIVPVKNVQLEQAKAVVSSISSATKASNLSEKAMKPGAIQVADVVKDYQLKNYGMKLPEEITQDDYVEL